MGKILARGCYTIVDESYEYNGKLFYHYTNINALMNIINDGKFRNTNIHYLNDKKEFDHYFELVDEIMSQPKHRNTDEAKYYLDHKLSSLPERKMKFFISSFTTQKDNHYMWEAYCKAGGVAMGIQHESIIDTLCNKNNFHFQKCIYTYEEKIDSINAKIKSYYEDPQPTNKKLLNFVDSLIFGSLFAKNEEYGIENEWRLISVEMDPRSNQIGFVHKYNVLVPYYEIGLDKNIIREIVMGPSPDSQYLADSLRFFLRHSGLSNRVTLSPTNSSLRRV